MRAQTKRTENVASVREGEQWESFFVSVESSQMLMYFVKAMIFERSLKFYEWSNTNPKGAWHVQFVE